MLVEKGREAPTLLDILDRVLDKGIVIDGWSVWSVAGLELFQVQVLMVVASIDTHALHDEAVGRILGRPAVRPFPPSLNPPLPSHARAVDGRARARPSSPRSGGR